jgi:hypothetical protein
MAGPYRDHHRPAPAVADMASLATGVRRGLPPQGLLCPGLLFRASWRRRAVCGAAPHSSRALRVASRSAPRTLDLRASATPEGPLRGQATVLPSWRAAPPGGRSRASPCPRAPGSGGDRSEQYGAVSVVTVVYCSRRSTPEDRHEQHTAVSRIAMVCFSRRSRRWWSSQGPSAADRCFGVLPAHAVIMWPRPAFGGAARPKGQARRPAHEAGLPGAAEAHGSRAAKRSRSDAVGALEA